MYEFDPDTYAEDFLPVSLMEPEDFPKGQE